MRKQVDIYPERLAEIRTALKEWRKTYGFAPTLPQAVNDVIRDGFPIWKKRLGLKERPLPPNTHSKIDLVGGQGGKATVESIHQDK